MRRFIVFIGIQFMMNLMTATESTNTHHSDYRVVRNCIIRVLTRVKINKLHESF